MKAAAVLMLTGAAACAAPVSPPAQAEQPFFAGVWAPRPENCRDFPWTFQESRLDAPGAVSCRWSRRQPTATGVILHGSCTGEGTVQTMEIEVDRAGRGRITIDAQMWHERVTLQACPRPRARP